MKRLIVLAMAGLIFTVVSAPMADEATTQPTMNKGMMSMCRSSDAHKWMRMKKHKEIVATKDGGVVVMSGNKLYKYDKFLDLKKIATIPEDNDDMSEMKGCCSMSQMMKKNDSEKLTEPSEDDKHKNHH